MHIPLLASRPDGLCIVLAENPLVVNSAATTTIRGVLYAPSSSRLVRRTKVQLLRHTTLVDRYSMGGSSCRKYTVCLDSIPLCLASPVGSHLSATPFQLKLSDAGPTTHTPQCIVTYTVTAQFTSFPTRDAPRRTRSELVIICPDYVAARGNPDPVILSIATPNTARIPLRVSLSRNGDSVLVQVDTYLAETRASPLGDCHSKGRHLQRKTPGAPADPKVACHIHARLLQVVGYNVDGFSHAGVFWSTRQLSEARRALPTRPGPGETQYFELAIPHGLQYSMQTPQVRVCYKVHLEFSVHKSSSLRWLRKTMMRSRVSCALPLFVAAPCLGNPPPYSQ